MTTAVDAPKLYTTAEIKAFTLAQAEEFAKSLRWTKKGYYGHNPAPYVTHGFPQDFGNYITIVDRKDYLIRRLLLAKQRTWNPGVKALVEAKKKAEKAAKEHKAKIDALMPKVKIETEVTVKLYDTRPRGHIFKVWTKGDNICFQQDTRNDYDRVGAKICDAQFRVNKKDYADFLDAIQINTSKLITRLTKENAKLKVNISLELKGSTHVLAVQTSDKIAYVAQQGTNAGSMSAWWHFNISDLQIVGDVLEAAAKVEVPAVPALVAAKEKAEAKIAALNLAPAVA